MEKGYVQVYTGNGKGKTTAALGLGFRAVGRGFNVLLVQFLKSMDTGELESIHKFPHFTVTRLGETNKFSWTLTTEEKDQLIKNTQREWSEFVEGLQANPVDVLILDEVMGALKVGLITIEQLADFIDNKSEGMELILTGRDVPKEIEDRADLITEMKKIRHYYDQGVVSRDGIER